MSKREYTLSREAHRQRKAASARAAAGRKAARAWRSIRVPAELAARIEEARIAGGDSAAWQVIERAILII
ncbi:MAG: hypothetical protein EOM69_06685 [Clostridia bacterium]|nr:hypothetical protein [Clostridia bacterium]